MREEEKARERKLLERYEESINMIRTDQEDNLINLTQLVILTLSKAFDHKLGLKHRSNGP